MMELDQKLVDLITTIQISEDWTKETEKSDSGHTIPTAVKHKGVIYHYTGKSGVHTKSGQASHEYEAVKDGKKTGERVWRTIDGTIMNESIESINEDVFSQGRKDWGTRMDAIIAAQREEEEKKREEKKAKIRDQIEQGNKEYYAARKAVKEDLQEAIKKGGAPAKKEYIVHFERDEPFGSKTPTKVADSMELKGHSKEHVKFVFDNMVREGDVSGVKVKHIMRKY